MRDGLHYYTVTFAPNGREEAARQLVEKTLKKSKKGVDKAGAVWYSNQAVRESGECK